MVSGPMPSSTLRRTTSSLSGSPSNIRISRHLRLCCRVSWSASGSRSRTMLHIRECPVGARAYRKVSSRGPVVRHYGVGKPKEPQNWLSPLLVRVGLRWAISNFPIREVARPARVDVSDTASGLVLSSARQSWHRRRSIPRRYGELTRFVRARLAIGRWACVYLVPRTTGTLFVDSRRPWTSWQVRLCSDGVPSGSVNMAASQQVLILGGRYRWEF